jgi:hypothetical protein
MFARSFFSAAPADWHGEPARAAAEIHKNLCSGLLLPENRGKDLTESGPFVPARTATLRHACRPASHQGVQFAIYRQKGGTIGPFGLVLRQLRLRFLVGTGAHQEYPWFVFEEV